MGADNSVKSGSNRGFSMAKRTFPFASKKGIDRLQKNNSCPVTPPVMNEFYKFTDLAHPSHILVGLHKQWTAGLFLDITIRVNDVSVRAHKSVLSAFSRYFEALFESDMSDAGHDEIILPDIHVSGTAIRLLVEFAYCGTLEITPDNIQELLYAANFLCIDAVISACCSYIQNNLSIENCVDVLELAVTLDLHELQQNIELFMISQLEEIIKQEIFLKLQVKQLLGLLENELIVLENGFWFPEVEQEEKILKMILRFVEAKPELSHEHLPTLLSHGVRLMLLPMSVLVHLKSSNSIQSSPECLKLLDRILSSEISSEEKSRWEHPRLSKVQYEKSAELATVDMGAPIETFDDGNLVPNGQLLFVTGMKVYTRRWSQALVVGGIEVFYDIGQSILHGSAGYRSEDGPEDGEFHLGPGERIVSMTAHAGWMIDRLEFTTSRGNVIGPFGGNGGNSSHYPTSDCSGISVYLAYITGTVDVTQSESAVRNLSFVWGFHKRSS